MLPGESAIGYNVRLRGTLPGPLAVSKASKNMVRANCDRCFKRHVPANMACSASSGVRAIYRRGQLYELRTGTVVHKFRLRITGAGAVYVHT